MRRFYDRIHWMYGFIERRLGPTLDKVLDELHGQMGPTETSTALEYGCGSGLLTGKLGSRFLRVVGKDISVSMLDRARKNLGQSAPNVSFEEGNLLDIREPDGAYDYVYVSFALHLFSPGDQIQIMRRLLGVAAKELIIIDHAPPWELGVALVEWLEGSYYNEFMETDFAQVADAVGGMVSLQTLTDCLVMRWTREIRPTGSPDPSD